MVVIAAWLPPGPVTLVVVLGLTGWAWNARVVRAQVATMRDELYWLLSCWVVAFGHFMY